MLMLSAPAIVIGIVVCMLTGMPRSMIRNNLYKRGKFGENLTLDRDLNASINIYKAGILPSVKLTEKPSPSKAW